MALESIRDCLCPPFQISWYVARHDATIKPKHAFSLFETSVSVLGYSGLVKFLFPVLIESLSMTFTADGKRQRLITYDFLFFSCNP